MIIKIHATEFDAEDAVHCVRKLYLEQPSECYLMATWRRIGCEWKGPMTYPLYRFPIIHLREWDYQDVFEIMMIYLRLSEEDVTKRIRLLSEIGEFVAWRPRAIAHSFLVFDILSSQEDIRRKVSALVEQFQIACGYRVFSSKFDGFWVGARHKWFAHS